MRASIPLLLSMALPSTLLAQDAQQPEAAVREALIRSDELSQLISTTVKDLFDDSKILTGLVVKPKTFERGASMGGLALGLEYSYSRQVISITERADKSWALSLDAHARGNFSFERNINPSDFLDTGLDITVFQAFGGVTKRTDLTETQKDELANARQAKNNALSAATTDLERRAIRAEIREDLAHRLGKGPEVFWKGGVHGSLESNQDFSSQQTVIGLYATGSARSYNDSYGWLNVLDYPFAALRMFTQGSPFQPSPEFLPQILVGIDLVDASKNDLRRPLAGGDDEFMRLRSSIGFTTRAGHLAGDDLMFGASLCFFHELAAPVAVRAAGIDEQVFFQAELRTSSGLSLSYASGQLPFDATKSDYFELGFRVTF